MPKPIPTEAEVDMAWEAFNVAIDKLTFVPEFIIEDYPIGGDFRGRCRLGVDFKRGHGYRTNKTTTNKDGRWYRPKGSVYQPWPIFVVTGIPFKDGETTAGWLKLCPRTGPYLCMANYEELLLCEPPCYTIPRRETSHYTVTVNGVESERKMLRADNPALCDAWERWFDHFKRLMERLAPLAAGGKR